MSEFNPDLLEIRHQAHLNGGREFNITSYGIYYVGEFLGEWCRGRRNKNENFSEVQIDEQRFSMPKDREKVVEAAKDKFLKLMESEDALKKAGGVADRALSSEEK